MGSQAELVERVRELLAPEQSIREVSMFGGRAFMVNDAMVVSAGKQGTLLVRVPADDHDALLGRPGASQAEMGAGRSMGPGWIDVSAEAVADEAGLSAWLEVALAHNRTITDKR